MSQDPSPASVTEQVLPTKTAQRSLLHRLKGFLRKHEPEDQEDIQEALSAARAKGILPEDTYTMVSGALSFVQSTVSDIMIPRSRMDILNVDMPINELLPIIIEKGHSRFPVYEGERDNIIGLILAKDLLRCMVDSNITLRQLVRPAYFVPETKHLNQLLSEFRQSRNHIAIVIDEYGSITGLLTMEDVLEEIVGDIEDETDEDQEQTIFPESESSWRVMGSTEIEDFNKAIQANIPENEYITIGGWLAAELDHIPKRGESYVNDGLRFRVLKADDKRVLWIHVKRMNPLFGMETE